MLMPDIRLSFWEKVYVVIHQLFIDTEDALDSDFAPYSFKKGVLVEPDKDTPKVKRLFNLLADLDAFLQIEHSRSKAECTQWEEERDRMLESCEAWELGLCPKVMLKVFHWYETESGGYSAGAWEEIAKLKQVQGINKDDTLQAIALWEAAQPLKRIAS